MHSLTLCAAYSDVVKNVHYWNADLPLGLTPHGEKSGSAVWSIGDFLITVRAVDAKFTEVVLRPFKMIPADHATAKCWNELGKTFKSLRWIETFSPLSDTAHTIQTLFQLTEQRAELPIEDEAYMLRSKKLAREDLAPLYPNNPDDLIWEVERLWQEHCRMVEQARTTLHERATLAHKTAQAAAEDFGSQTTTQSDAGKGGEGQAAQSTSALTASERGVVVGGNLSGSIVVTGDNPTIVFQASDKKD